MRLALTPIVEVLRAAGCRNVEGVLELVDLTEAPRALPAFFVVPGREVAGANTNDSGRSDQAVDVEFGVVVLVDGTRRNRAGISEELKEQVDRVIGALAGWTHPGASRACAYAGGRLAFAGARSCGWDVRFRARYHLRKTQR